MGSTQSGDWHSRARAIRSRIEAARSSTRSTKRTGRTTFSHEIQRDAVILASQRHVAGATLQDTAAAIGVGSSTLRYWIAGETRDAATGPASKSFAPVAVVPDEPLFRPPKNTVAIVFPSGLRIENVSLAEAIHFAREIER